MTHNFYSSGLDVAKAVWNSSKLLVVGALACAGLAAPGFAQTNQPGQAVFIVYNSAMPDSLAAAKHYADRRGVPPSQMLGLKLPKTETMTRKQFRQELEQPLLKEFEQKGIFRYRSEIKPAGKNKPGEGLHVISESKIRFLVLCYGVPLKITADPKLDEDGAEKLPETLRRNEAAVDSELAALPLLPLKPKITGPMANRLYGVTNAAYLHPVNGILPTTRLDGPSPEIAMALVDKALWAETNGLWGRAYFDARGLTNSDYKLGDDWIKAASQHVRRFGFETILDENPWTFGPAYPLSQIAIYAGWYEGQVNGPFTLPEVEFVPGAIAYHLHSFSAATIRSTFLNWVGPLLHRGATATLGCVEEPYLQGTPDVAVFFRSLLLGFSLGEAAYAAQSSLSWQTTVVGDPLYRPFMKQGQALHDELASRQSNLIEWSHLRVLNLNGALDVPVPDLIAYIQKEPAAAQSSVLQEKLGDLYFKQGKITEALDPFDRALRLSTSRQQRIRLNLLLARTHGSFAQDEKAFGYYEQFVKNFPDYTDILSIYQKLAPLAEKIGKTSEAEQYRKEIARLTSTTGAAK